MTTDTVLETLYDKITEILPETDRSSLTPASSLADLGLNSMERAEVIIDTLFDHQVKMPMTAFAGCGNVGEIAAVIAAKADVNA